MEAGGRASSLHGRVVKGVGHLGHDEAMEARGRAFSLNGRAWDTSSMRDVVSSIPDRGVFSPTRRRRIKALFGHCALRKHINDMQ